MILNNANEGIDGWLKTVASNPNRFHREEVAVVRAVIARRPGESFDDLRIQANRLYRARYDRARANPAIRVISVSDGADTWLSLTKDAIAALESSCLLEEFLRTAVSKIKPPKDSLISAFVILDEMIPGWRKAGYAAAYLPTRKAIVIGTTPAIASWDLTLRSR